MIKKSKLKKSKIMKAINSILKVIMIAGILSLTSCSNEDATPVTNTVPTVELKSYSQSSFELELLDLVNEYRVSKGLNALSIIEHISFVSSGHNDYMINVNTASHDGFENRKNNLEIALGAKGVGENVAAGYATAQATLNAWIASTSHRLNMESNYTHYGLSVKQDASGKKYYTLMFIRK